MLLLQNNILEMVARGETLSATTEALCQRVEALLPSVVCSILSVDDQGRLHPLAGPGLPIEFSIALDGLAIGPDVGSCGAAIWFRRAVEATDIANDSRWTGYAEWPLSVGLKACWSSPVIGGDGCLLGAFALYFREARSHTEQEAVILDASIHLCAIAMERDRQAAVQYRLAYVDLLTDLPNRAAFDLATVSSPSVHESRSALLLIDLDNLKTTNDTFGHRAGDFLIQAAAAAIRKGAAPYEAFRLGGDEFAVRVHGQDASDEGLERLAASILEGLSEPFDCDGRQTIPRATIGGASARPNTPGETLRQWADFALYHAKETLRGRFVAYSPDLGTTMTRRLAAIRDVGAALAEDRIDAHYQAIVRIDTEEIVGLEALFRVVTPDGEVRSAGEYVEATTDVHTATRLTQRMLGIVARDVRTWLDLGIWFQHVGINAASADFQGGLLHEAIKAAFGQEGVSLEHVILEITESVYMGQGGGVALEIQSLRQQGLRVALDDFGTGFASLTHLLSLPVDIIKIDKSFVSRMEPESRSAAIVEGIIAIAAKLGIRVVAEGIETREQAKLLESFGCNLGQGFLYSRPIDRQAVTQLLFAKAQKRDDLSTGSAQLEQPGGERHRRMVRYAVLRFGDEWRVVSQRSQFGHFASLEMAVRFSLKLAQEAASSGLRVELLYCELGGELKTLNLSDFLMEEVGPDRTDTRPLSLDETRMSERMAEG